MLELAVLANLRTGFVRGSGKCNEQDKRYAPSAQRENFQDRKFGRGKVILGGNRGREEKRATWLPPHSLQHACRRPCAHFFILPATNARHYVSTGHRIPRVRQKDLHQAWICLCSGLLKQESERRTKLGVSVATWDSVETAGMSAPQPQMAASLQSTGKRRRTC